MTNAIGNIKEVKVMGDKVVFTKKDERRVTFTYSLETQGYVTNGVDETFTTQEVQALLDIIEQKGGDVRYYVSNEPLLKGNRYYNYSL